MTTTRFKTSAVIGHKFLPTLEKNAVERRFLLGAFALIFITSCATAFPEDQDKTEDDESDTEVYSGSDTETSPGTDSEEKDTFSDDIDTAGSDSDTDTIADSDTDTIAHSDSDTDTETDECPEDDQKIYPGLCGCGTPDTDSDGDGIPNCMDNCPNDASKTEPGICGCGIKDTDSDDDGASDCKDNCPADPDKTEPGECGCGTAESICDVVGTYHRLPVDNNWHIGAIERTQNGYRWVNAAGVEWTLVPDFESGLLRTQSDCPYYDSPEGDAFTLVLTNEQVTGFTFQGELYSRQN